MAEIKKKFMVTNDECYIRLLVATNLQRAGYETSEAPVGLGGLSRFISGRPGLFRPIKLGNGVSLK